jgi:hypothetical protein
MLRYLPLELNIQNMPNKNELIAKLDVALDNFETTYSKSRQKQEFGNERRAIGAIIQEVAAVDYFLARIELECLRNKFPELYFTNLKPIKK